MPAHLFTMTHCERMKKKMTAIDSYSSTDDELSVFGGLTNILDSDLLPESTVCCDYPESVILAEPVVQVPFDGSAQQRKGVRTSSRISSTAKEPDNPWEQVVRSAGGKPKKRKNRSKQIQTTRVETPYPKEMKPEMISHDAAACYQDFVDVFCKTMWETPNMMAIQDALRVAFQGHQSRYGKVIIPDQTLADLFAKAESSPDIWDDLKDEAFVDNINSRGWHKISNVMSKHEVLIVAIMSISAHNFSMIKNRHGWSNKQEEKQNRCDTQKFSGFFFFLYLTFFS